MSLEQQLEKLNAGLNEFIAILTAEIKAKQPGATTPPPAPAKTAAKVAPAPAPKAAEKYKEVERHIKEAQESEEITDDEMRKVVGELLKKRGRDTALSLLQSLGASKATEVAPENRARFIADATSMLAS